MSAPADTEPALPHFFHHLGLEWERDGDVVIGRVAVDPHLCVPGTSVPRASMLATFADITAGMYASTTLASLAPTLDLSLHLFRAPPTVDLALESRVLRAGRRVIVGETWFTTADDDEPFAVAITTFMDAGLKVDGAFRMPTARDEPFSPRYPLTEPIDRRAGVEVVGPGVIDIALRPDVSNGRTLQGGIVALIAERACETALAETEPHVVTGLDLRYLSGARAGPIRATARVLRSKGTSAQLWVEVRDLGDADRLLVHVVAAAEPLASFV